MSMPDMYIKFKEKTAEALEVDQSILDEYKLSDLKEYNSLGVIDLGLVIEEVFGWEIPLEALENAGYLRDLYAYIEVNKPAT